MSSGVIVLTSLGLALAVATPTFGQCTNDAGTGDFDEAEGCAVANNDDQFNGGCNSDPPIYSEVDPGNVVCGTASNFDNARTCNFCTIDDDCNANEVCSGGICLDTCVDANDCPLGQTCDDTDGDQTPDTCSGACPSDGACDVDLDGDNIADTCSGTKDTRRRDTDWHRLTQADLQAADADGNGVVQVVSTLTGEIGTNLVTFIIGLGGVGQQCEDANGASTVTFPGSTGFYNGDPANNDVDCSLQTAGTFEPSTATLVIADYPNGIVIFAATGECDGSSIVTGDECSVGLNDYNLQIELIEPPTACAADEPNHGACNEANPGVGGCEDPECCKIVCLPAAQGGFNPLCCQIAPGWIQQCADAAIDLGCAPELGEPICMSTDVDANADLDGYLRVCADPYGAWSSDSFCGTACDGTDNFTDPNWGDEYKPEGFDRFEMGFTSGFMLFDRPNQLRELLANILQWTNTFLTPDITLSRAIVGLGSTEFDDNGDNVTDRLTSEFDVGGALSLNFLFEQKVERLAGAVSLLSQTYNITNTSGSPASFRMLRVYDGDFFWPDTSNTSTAQIDDNVGTGTNGNPQLERHVYMNEDGEAATGLTISSTAGNTYYGSKLGVDPDGKGPGPAMGFGTDSQQWDDYGVPEGWENFVAGIGYDTDGNSGPAPAGSNSPFDGSIGLEIEIDLAASGPTSQFSFTFHHTYGSTTPLGEGGPTCPWDCANDDGAVNVSDLLQLLAEWDVTNPPCDGGGVCDFDGNGCVEVADLLKLLAHYDPAGVGCPQ